MPDTNDSAMLDTSACHSETCTCVLLVEDNPGDVRLLREYLALSDAAEFEVVVAPRLSQALDALRARDFDIVLLDLSLPDADGIETLTALLREAPDVPTVVLTGLADDALAVRAVQSGAQDYLIKGQYNEATLARSLLYAIERQRMQSALKTLSVQDALTGLLNRRGFETMTAQHIKAAQRENRQLEIFYLDLDGMKQINDNYGHREGDWALTKTAEALRQTFRESDILARLGGDEFVVCASLRSHDDVASLLARLQHNVATINDRHRRDYVLNLSIGAATLNPNHDDLNAALERADRALYEAKREKNLER